LDTVSLTSSAVIPVRYDRALVSRPGRYVGTVSGFDAADSAAGAAFRLVTTIIVAEPLEGGRLTQRARKLSGGAAARTFVMPAADGVLGVRATLRGDTTANAQLFVFEGSGRPVPSEPNGVTLGGEHGAAGIIRVNRNDLAGGAYETVLQAMPGREISYDLEIVSPPVRVLTDSAAGAVSFAADRDTSLSVAFEQVGSDTTYVASMAGGAVHMHRFAVPAWARSVRVDVAVTDGWPDVTDLAISLLGVDGERLDGGAMNYPHHRVTMELEENGNPREIVVELFPGLAIPLPQLALNARVRVMFAPASARALGGTVPVTIGSRAPVRVPLPVVQPFGPGGWSDRIRVRAGGPGVWLPVEAELSVQR
jgi:hypothetical protein